MWFKFYTKYDSPFAAQYLLSKGYSIGTIVGKWYVHDPKMSFDIVFRGNHHQLCKFAGKHGWVK